MECSIERDKNGQVNANILQKINRFVGFSGNEEVRALSERATPCWLRIVSELHPKKPRFVRLLFTEFDL